MELYEKGLITQRDTGGLDLSWGNHKSALEMLEKITYRQGLGDLLAEGVMRASQQFGQGSEQFAIHVKGADIIEEFRATIGWGLGVVTAPRVEGAWTAPRCRKPWATPISSPSACSTPPPSTR